jgi:pyridinium-3,5-biscarboxylic acid mononucleotide sulfurtransferase
MNDTLRSRYEKLIDIVSGYGKIAIAFSGGADSSFLAYASYNVLKDKMCCITICDEIQPVREMAAASAFTARYGIMHYIINIDMTETDIFRANEKDRCYRCKKKIFGLIADKAKSEGFMLVADGTNKDDESDYRPGMRAIAELGIASPLREAGLTKSDIYELSKEIGPDIWNKPALACLATRIPYNEPVTKEKARMIDNAEMYIRDHGFFDVRVRYQNKTARIEIGSKEFAKLTSDIIHDIDTELKNIGFTRVCLDLGGYRKGNMNNG